VIVEREGVVHLGQLTLDVIRRCLRAGKRQTGGEDQERENNGGSDMRHAWALLHVCVTPHHSETPLHISGDTVNH
jgi:hypothetical protein